MIHVAILQRSYLDLVLSGAKTIELRLTRTRREPFGQVAVGERLYFKQSGGRFAATAVIRGVRCLDSLTPSKIEAIKAKYNDRILGSDDFWQSRSSARFLTLVRFSKVERLAFGPRMMPHHMKGWQCLPDERDVYPECLAKKAIRRTERPVRARAVDASTVGTFPIRRVLTSGNLRHHHIYLNDAVHLFPAQCLGGATRADAGKPVTLEFDDGTVAKTDVVKARRLFRARAPWGKWFASRRAQVGDTVIIERRSDRRYAVMLRQAR